jgi:hypothetical protein
MVTLTAFITDDVELGPVRSPGYDEMTSEYLCGIQASLPAMEIEMEAQSMATRIDGRWIVKFDHLEKRELNTDVTRQEQRKYSVPFRLFDDDGVLYFSGAMTEKLYDSHNILEPLDVLMPDYGCTELQCLNPKNQSWETI